MKIRYLVVLILSLFFSNHLLAKDAPIETGLFNNDAIYGYDPVAYFTDNKPVKGSEAHQMQWRGATWSFASDDHLQMFKADPTKYAPQYGGYCSYAMANGRLVGIDEEAFSIVDGKLYLNYSKSVQEDWLEDMRNYIKKADDQYPKVVDLPPEQ